MSHSRNFDGKLPNLAELRDVNEEDDFGNAEIHKTVLRGMISEVKKFKKDEFSKQNCKGETPLHLACQSDRVSFDIVKYICEEYKVVIKSRDSRQNTPLHLACASRNIEKVKTLCNFEINLEARNEDEETPLLVACKVGACEIVNYLLQKGANPLAQNKDGKTVRRIATSPRNENMLEAIKTRKKDGKVKNLIRTISGRENEELIALRNDVNEKESIIEELVRNRSVDLHTIDRLNNEVDCLNSKIGCLTIECNRLAVERQQHNYEVHIPYLSHFTDEERNILVEHLTTQFINCHFHAEFGTADEAGCSSKLIASASAGVNDTVKTIMNNIKKDIQKGLTWKTSPVTVNYLEPAIIPSGLSSRSFLMFVISGKLIIRFLQLVVSVYQANIAEEDVDAVLVSTDKHLKSFIGVAEAIAQKAGPAKVHERCQSALRERRYQPLNVGEVIHIDSGHRLKARYIMYTVGPEIDAKANSPDVCCERLRETFENALRYADQTLKVQSVAVPAISAGDVMFCSCHYVLNINIIHTLLVFIHTHAHT